ncbi:MAG: arginine--tRNA ligase [Gammaproteobacteria bacterium]|nr:arginine--tRNA ligase [Gammaproteobacteria bacterium]MCH9764198.1 arginine--tRNA ligase [Gammaproteobacteria bacterium]
MKLIIEQLLQQALDALKATGVVPEDFQGTIKIEPTKDTKHGDFSTNLAMVLAKSAGLSPMLLAEKVVSALPAHDLLKQTEIAAPGFINFFMNAASRASFILERMFREGVDYGKHTFGAGQRVLLEYVSANPTGPLHVGHGRGAAFGASLANVLEMAGFSVTREYYVNDAGRQMDILAVSVWLRYLECSGESINFPSNAYKGGYVRTIGEKIYLEHATQYKKSWDSIVKDLPLDAPDGGDKEQYIDAMIQTAKQLLGETGFILFHQSALDYVLSDIKEDLAEFGVKYHSWFSERSLLDSGAIKQGIEALTKAGYTFEDEGAIWFRATDFGDEKDRVLVRANGQPTYFASDVAYHWDKYQRGFDVVMDLFGADHHGYIPRLKAAVTALGHDEKALRVFMVQFAILYRQGERLQMSTRSGSFVTLRELREEVGRDAARFFYVMRKPEQHMDFDLDLAKSESRDNPVYYIQYAHARICSVFKQLETRDMSWDKKIGIDNSACLTDAHEIALIAQLERYPDVIELAVKTCEPHQIAYYLRELANALHAYYNSISLLCEQESLRCSRLTLVFAVREVLRNGLQLLGVSAPESM